jgi:hypothetical protein
MNTFKKHGFVWIMLVSFLSSLALHGVFSYLAYQTQDGVLQYTFLRDVFENWQSEFLQLMAQVGLSGIFLAVGSPQSKSEEERLEAKLDFLMTQINPIQADRLQQELAKKYPKK